MAKFVVESEHANTAEACMKALDEAVKMGSLDKIVFGCKAGEHKGWAFVEAETGQQAIDSVIPKGDRSKAIAHEVSKFTVDEIKAAHKK